MAKELLIIIPAYNEEANIGGVLDELDQLGMDSVADVLVVNDASTDGTQQVVREKGRQVVTHVFNLGYGEGLQTGYHFAVRQGYRYVIQMDGDGQHPACNIPPILERLRFRDPDGQGPDIVLGSRFIQRKEVDAVGLGKRVALRMFRGGIKLVTGRYIADPTTGLQGLNRKAFHFYAQYGHFDDKYPDANMIMQMLLLQFRIEEIPAVMRPRVAGKSMHSGLRPVWYMFRMWVSVLAVVFRIKVLKIDAGAGLQDVEI